MCFGFTGLQSSQESVAANATRDELWTPSQAGNRHEGMLDLEGDMDTTDQNLTIANTVRSGHARPATGGFNSFTFGISITAGTGCPSLK